MKDFYLVLNVGREATPEEIRSAYRRRAHELHPDKSGTESEPFLELQQAYSVLSDPALRSAYDRGSYSISIRFTERSPAMPAAAEPFQEIEPAGGFREVSLSQSFDRYEPSFEEVFERLWSNFNRSTRPKAERLESLTVDVPLSPQEAYAGGSARILVPVRAICPQCHGRGLVGALECWQCRGQGAAVGQYPLDIPYPGGLRRDYIVRVPLDPFGIHNFYMTVRFRPSEAG